MVKDCLKLILFLALARMASAENIIFPADAGVKNVKDYGAQGDGLTDDTQAIQKAIDEVKGIPDTLYFPNGTYLVSGGVGIFQGKAHSRDRFIAYQGQSEAGTVIRLKDNCPGFGDPLKPKIMFSVYEGEGTGDVMRSYVRNLTVDVGRGNRGAVGLRFTSNNSGAMDRVTIRSSDPQGAGKLGLDLTQGQVGPCLIQRVTVIGFDYGVEVAHTFSVVLEHLTLQHQNVIGPAHYQVVPRIQQPPVTRARMRIQIVEGVHRRDARSLQGAQQQRVPQVRAGEVHHIRPLRQDLPI